MGLFEKANQIAVLSGGRRASWLPLVAAEGAPPSVSSGISTQGALKTLVILDLREDVVARRCRFTVATLGLTDVYRVIINGNNADYDAGGAGAATLQDVLEGIRDAINAAAGVKNIVTASVTDEDGDDTDDTVLIVGKSENDYTIDHSVGTDPPPEDGDLASVADPTIASLRMFAAAGGLVPNKPDSWRLIRDGEVLDVDFRGFIDRLDTGSIDRVHVEVFDVDNPGDAAKVTLRLPDLVIGPSPLP